MPPRLGCRVDAGLSVTWATSSTSNHGLCSSFLAHSVLTVLSQSSAYCCSHWGPILSSETSWNEATSARS